MPFYRKMVEAHRVLLGIAEKHIAISKETIRAGGAGAASSMLAQGGCVEYIEFLKGSKTTDVLNFFKGTLPQIGSA